MTQSSNPQPPWHSTHLCCDKKANVTGHQRHLIFLLFALCFLCLGISGCASFHRADAAQAEASQKAFQEFLEDEFSSSFQDELINLHYTLKNPELLGIEKPTKASSPITSDYAVSMKENLSATAEALSQIKKEHLTEEQQHIYSTLEKYLFQQIALCDYPQFVHFLSSGTGLSSNLPLTLAEYAFYSEDDVKDYLSILPQIPELLQQAFEWEQAQTDAGFGMTDFAIEDTIQQIETFLDTSDTNLLIETFEDRLNTLSELSSDQKSTYLQNNRELVTHQILPAFSSLKSNLTTLLSDAPEEAGLCQHEDGLAYYELLLASTTLSDRSLSTMIQSLENRLEDLSDRAGDVMLKSPGIYSIYANGLDGTNDTDPSGTAGEGFGSLSPKEMLLKLQEAIEADFPALSDVTYTVEPIPDALKNDTTAAYYLIPPFDSPEENRIYYGDSAEDNASLFMTLAHEGYPGHLYQQNYLLQHDLPPVFYILDMTGYKEGWAFYAEIQAIDYYDFGEYEEQYHDALVELYRCNLEYGYCISSLADLYVNGKGYSRDDLHSFLQTLGLDRETSDAIYEYAVEEPCTYLQYYIGYLEILSIRQSAEKKAGNDFDSKEFHQAFLDLGPGYYETLAKEMKK